MSGYWGRSRAAVFGRGGVAGVARNRTENASGEGGDAAGVAGQGPDAEGEKHKKGEARNSTEKKN